MILNFFYLINKKAPFLVGLYLILSAFFLISCANAPAKKTVEPTPEKPPESLPFTEKALAETVSENISARGSWTYYQYGLQAMENGEWLLARHYLDESLRQLVSEKYDSTYKVNATEDSLYRLTMPIKIVEALDEVYPNVANLAENAENFERNEVSLEGIDDLDESEADSAALKVIVSFLDTLDVSQFTLPIEFNDRVLQEIYYMTNPARGFMEGSLNRKTAYDSLVYSKLKEAEMPADLIYLSLVESGFKLKAYSRAKASGMWQFIPETGKRYGLEVDYWVDMRRNPELATTAALKYLKRLYNEFGDWLLAMAAYNCGEGRVRRLLKEISADTTRDTLAAITYWDLNLPKETMRYVPRILAAMVIGHYPSEYGMTVSKQSRPDFDTVTVFDSFPLEEVAKLLNVKEDTLRSLNMELIKWCTPPNKDSYLLRLPVGTRSAFVEGYDLMEKNNFSSWHHHKVKKGENLGVIARQYGIKVSELKQANDMKSTRIRAGQSLLIPIKVTPKPKSKIQKKPEVIRTYIIQPNDNLASIARKFGTSQENLRSWNNMDASTLLNPGDTLFVSKPSLKPIISTENNSQNPKVPLKILKGEKYIVKANDTYASIAAALQIPASLLIEKNRGFIRRLTVGDSLVVPEYKPTLPPKKQPKTSKESPKSSKTSPLKTSIYEVVAGDNLTVIAKRFGTTISNIQELNQMGNYTNISVGQKLKVSGENLDNFIIHDVKKGEGLWDIARQYKVTIEEIVRWNNLNDTKIKVGDKLKIKR